jgi:predicted nucleotidyltransferase
MNSSSPTLETIIKLLKTFKEHHQAEYQLKSLGIFGSYARYQANAESDIDIFFETEAPNLFKTAHLHEELETLLGLPVDLVRLRNSMNPRLKSHIKKDALYV